MSNKIHPYYYSASKRLFDLIFSIILLILSLPLIIITGLLVWASSGCPIVFKQRRAGLNKDPFLIYKFRTMIKNASHLKQKYRQRNQAPEPMFKIFNDPRLTKIGKHLSHLGLDESLQLINVLKGDMSLVGPRPLPIKEAKMLPRSWNFRFKVKPGLFSDWSLNPRRHDSLLIWKQLDQKTVKRAGIISDLQLISKNILKKITILFKS